MMMTCKISVMKNLKFLTQCVFKTYENADESNNEQWLQSNAREPSF
jgi:hypothetical protein